MTSSIAKIIKARRTIHNFQAGRIPPREPILEAMDHAVWAPNHYATEPWHFYLLGETTKARVCELNAELVKASRGDEAAQKKFKRWMDVPGWVVLTCQESKNGLRAREDYAACCCVAQNFMLYLWEQGIGVKWTTGAVTRHEDFFRILGMDPEKEIVVGLFWYGYAEEIPKINKQPAREKLTELP